MIILGDKSKVKPFKVALWFSNILTGTILLLMFIKQFLILKQGIDVNGSGFAYFLGGIVGWWGSSFVVGLIIGGVALLIEKLFFHKK